MTALEPVRWGILGAANIAVKKVIPAMRASRLAVPVAIASRDIAKARAAAAALGIPRAYGSYEELLADADVEAVYNPLPNHLHVPWSIRAAQAGKHVLCEKPIALSASEARTLLAARDANHVQIAEAFMVRTHPQWQEVERVIASGRVGGLRLMTAHFSYYRRDPADIRSQLAWGGGALMDVGCYPIFIARWMFGAEPDAGGGDDRARPRPGDRPPNVGDDALPDRSGDVHLCRTARAISAGASLWRARPDRGGDPVQRAAGPSVQNLRRRRFTVRTARVPK